MEALTGGRRATRRPRQPDRFGLAAPLIAAVAGLACSPAARGQTEAPPPADPPAAAPAPDLPLPSAVGRELMLFEDVPMVVSATRQAQPLRLSPVPVSVVSSSDIHFSGATNLAEVLQFYPGTDVLRLDRNRWAVGVRGFHHIFSDRTLLLVNGRNASSPFSGAIDLLTLPVLVEDVDRIEIVRGPAGASWGANAFNGVINIITKKPADVQGILASVTLSEFGDTYSQFRWGAADGDWSWRISGGYEQRESSEDAIHGDTFESRDFNRSIRFAGEAVRRLGDRSSLTFGLAHAHIEQGDFGFAEFWPMRDERHELTRLFARLDHEFDSGATGYLQTFTNIEDSNVPTISRNHNVEFDIEAQLNFTPAESHRVSVGGNTRWVWLDPSIYDPQMLTYADAPYSEFWAGIFALDRWQVNRRLILEPQARFDYYNGTHSDWSGRLTALYSLDARDRHILRISGAKAFRAPLPGLRDAAGVRSPLPSPPFPPGLHAVNLLPAGDVDNEQVWSAEIGYQAQLTDQLVLRADAYYQWYEDLVGVTAVSLEPAIFQLAQVGSAQAPGAELELSYRTQDVGLSLWYAYNGFEPGHQDQDIRAFYPAEHKAGATGRITLPGAWTASALYRWTNTTPVATLSGEPVPAFHRLDLTLAKAIAQGRGELLVGVSDVFDQTDHAIVGLGSYLPHETPGRTFFIRFQVKF